MNIQFGDIYRLTMKPTGKAAERQKKDAGSKMELYYKITAEDNVRDNMIATFGDHGLNAEFQYIGGQRYLFTDGPNQNSVQQLKALQEEISPRPKTEAERQALIDQDLGEIAEKGKKMDEAIKERFLTGNEEELVIEYDNIPVPKTIIDTSEKPVDAQQLINRIRGTQA